MSDDVGVALPDSAALSSPKSARSTKNAGSTSQQAASWTWSARTWRSLVHASFRQFHTGSLSIVDAGGTSHFGEVSNSDLHAEIVVHDPGVYRRVTWGGTIGAAESYMAGEWTTEDLTAVVRLMIRNARASSALERFGSFLLRPWHRFEHWRRRNNLTNSRRNIAAHYDLGNDFYRLWLDQSLAYSSAYFERPEMNLHEAQIAKFDRLCRKLDLRPGDHLLEIGCGWGGLAIHAATQYGCRVTGTTISAEQAKCVQERIEQAGLADKITLLTQDYRQLTGQYDKLVSVEMIEAVGPQFLDEYFRTCSRLLKPGGLMALQGITIADRLYVDYCRSVDFIQKYIFPGGHLPAVGRLLQTISQHTDLHVQQLEDLPDHYAQTLAAWRENFQSAEQDIVALGLPASFRRMWEYYLCYCEGGFRERQLGLIQMTLRKGV